MMNDDLTKCPICFNSNYIDTGKPIVSKEAAIYIKSDYRILKCPICEFYYTYPKISLTETQWRNLYTNEYFGKLPKWWIKKRARDRAYRLDWLQKNSAKPITNFLDIGCGEGMVLLEAAKRGWIPYGVDIADNRIQDAKDESIVFLQGSLLDASFADDFFDAIYLDSVLEHVVELKAFTEEVSRVVKPGGVIYIGIPNENSIYNDVRKIIFNMTGKTTYSVKAQPFKTPYHVVGFTKTSISSLFKLYNIEPVKIRIFGGPYEWLKKRILSRVFIVHIILIPVYIAGLLTGKAIYIEALFKKRRPYNKII